MKHQQNAQPHVPEPLHILVSPLIDTTYCTHVQFHVSFVKTPFLDTQMVPWDGYWCVGLASNGTQ